MRAAWIIGLAMAYVILAVISGIPEGTFFGGTGVETLWECITGFQTLDVTNPVTVGAGVLMNLGKIFVGLFEILSWKFSFFTGVWIVFRMLMFAISLGIIISLLLAIRGTGST